jgi:cytochrome c oxidase cbb3-type subunit III
MRLSAFLFCPVISFLCTVPAFGQKHQPQEPQFDKTTVERGRAQFKSSCGFCHGNDATGSRAPDLVRSAILSHDENGDLVAPVIRNGRPDKGMPAFSTLKDSQIADIVTFLHAQAYAALHSAQVPGDYPLEKLLTGNADAGKAYFNGAGGCSNCHSPTKDLAGIAKKYSPVDLQQHMVYPQHEAKSTAVVTTTDGKRFEGTVIHDDEYYIGIIGKDGWYQSWPRNKVKAEVHDPLQAHRDLMERYTDADIHNLFAYLETLK